MLSDAVFSVLYDFYAARKFYVYKLHAFAAFVFANDDFAVLVAFFKTAGSLHFLKIVFAQRQIIEADFPVVVGHSARDGLSARIVKHEFGTAQSDFTVSAIFHDYTPVD